MYLVAWIRLLSFPKQVQRRVVYAVKWEIGSQAQIMKALPKVLVVMMICLEYHSKRTTVIVHRYPIDQSLIHQRCFHRVSSIMKVQYFPSTSAGRSLIYRACLVRMANVKVQCFRELKEYIHS